MKEPFLLRAYRAFHRTLAENIIWPCFVSKARLHAGRELRQKFNSIPQLSKNSVSRVWFHAASVGELESLWSVIVSWANQPAEIVLTVFSESALGRVERLKAELEGLKGKVLFAGYSPWEGRWREILEKVRPSLFVTAKYEAWPELWCSLSCLEIPLLIVGAKTRPSLTFVNRACRFFGVSVPELALVLNSEFDRQELQSLFPGSVFHVVGDPRWDRVLERSKTGNARARQLTSFLLGLPKPWGILGSAWLEDIRLWGTLLCEVRGTVWVVPHQVDTENVQQIDRLLQSLGICPIRTSAIRSRDDAEVALNRKSMPCCVLVDEMGFLLELYASVDWAYVGGGFNAGVHSTIEPAVHAIPIAAGPKRAEVFPEIEELRRTGQLSLISDAKKLCAWMEEQRKNMEAGSTVRDEWKKQVLSRFGAAHKVCRIIDEMLNREQRPN